MSLTMSVFDDWGRAGAIVATAACVDGGAADANVAGGAAIDGDAVTDDGAPEWLRCQLRLQWRLRCHARRWLRFGLWTAACKLFSCVCRLVGI